MFALLLLFLYTVLCSFQFCWIIFICAENHTAGLYVEIFTQVNCGSESDSLSEFSRDKAHVPCQAGKNVWCCCRGTERIRSLPSVSNITYGKMPCGCRRACSTFLDISYSDGPVDSHCDLQSQLPMERLPTSRCSACCSLEKLQPETKGHVPLERCNKWPVHNSLTLVCDSRPSCIPVRHKTKGHVPPGWRRIPVRQETKGHVPLEQCNKWPDHNSLTLICDTKLIRIPIQHRTKEHVPLEQSTVIYQQLWP